MAPILQYIPDAKNVLVAPLHWGLGHASRCIPIIHELLAADKKIIIASDGGALGLLKKEFPQLPAYELPSYRIRYNGSSMLMNMIRQAPNILNAISSEFKKTQELVNKYEIDTIISDNRYGVKNPSCNNIIICHQINIQDRNQWVRVTATKINNFWLNKFDECWIPDDSEESLAGKLSEPKGLKKWEHIGLISRFEKIDTPIKRKILALLSGPEPNRSELEEKMINILDGHDYLMVRGVVEESQPPNPKVVNFLTAAQLNKEVCASEIVICRSGYSSIMDMKKLDKRAVLIPTPGQSEQEYLAYYLSKRNGHKFTFIKEKEIEKLISFIDEE